MRRGHLIIIFVLLFVLLALGTVEKTWQYDRAAAQKEKIDDALMFASDAAAEQIAVQYENGSADGFLKNVEVEFFRALSAGLGIYSDFDEMETIDFYVPLLIMTDTEGFYLNYLQEVPRNGEMVLERVWTECQPYTYADDEFIYRFYLNDEVYIVRKSSPTDVIKSTYKGVIENASLMSQLSSSVVFRSRADFDEVKRASIARSIEVAAGKAVNEHNHIAGQYGIAMYYSVPSFFDDYTPALEYPSFLAVFQGYPLSLRYNIIYNNCTTSAAYITRVTTYTVEVPNSITKPFAVYHKNGCPSIGAYGKVLPAKYTKEKAVSVYGAYACPDCFTVEDGVAILP